MRKLDRHGQHFILPFHLALEELAIMRPTPAMEAIKNQLDAFFHNIAPRFKILAEALKLIRPVTAAKAQHHTAIGKHIHESRIFYHADRVIKRQRNHAGSQLDSAGARREVGHIHKAIRHDAVSGAEVMLRDPGRIIAQRFGAQDFLSGARSDALMRIGFFHRVGVAGHQNAEFHFCFLLPRCSFWPQPPASLGVARTSMPASFSIC